MSPAAAESKNTAELATALVAAGFQKLGPSMIVGDWGDGVAHVVLTAWNDRFAGSLKLEMMFGMRFEDRDRLANYRELIGGARRPADHVGAEHSEASQVEN